MEDQSPYLRILLGLGRGQFMGPHGILIHRSDKCHKTVAKMRCVFVYRLRALAKSSLCGLHKEKLWPPFTEYYVLGSRLGTAHTLAIGVRMINGNFVLFTVSF